MPSRPNWFGKKYSLTRAGMRNAYRITYLIGFVSGGITYKSIQNVHNKNHKSWVNI